MFNGIYAPIATPFDGDEIDKQALKANLDLYSASRLAGLVVLGSNGEFAYLNIDEKMALLEFARQNTDSARRIIAGTGCESTRETIRLTKFAASVGADAALVITPSFYKGSMSEAALEQFFLDVAEASPIPIMLYNMPRNTGLNMASGLVCKLARHENIVGVKDSSGNIVQIAEIIHNSPVDFAVFAGSGSFLYPTLALGGVEGTLAVANIFPDLCVSLYEAVLAGEHEQAKQLQHRLLAPNAAVTSRWGIAGLKAALDMLGYRGGLPRRPMLPFNEANLPELRQILISAGAELEAGI
ncbi:MAG TPA: dihydrodipicolinate synthase family protein [Firmicutes bacterium]|nr:dihydrodipicolinate synthase family protein [Bacillota bacterium]